MPLILTDGELEKDVVIKIERAVSTSSTIEKTTGKTQRYCSRGVKLIGLLIIVGIVLLCVLLPNYLQNQNINNDKNSGTDPTNARLPEATL